MTRGQNSALRSTKLPEYLRYYKEIFGAELEVFNNRGVGFSPTTPDPVNPPQPPEHYVGASSSTSMVDKPSSMLRCFRSSRTLGWALLLNAKP